MDGVQSRQPPAHANNPQEPIPKCGICTVAFGAIMFVTFTVLSFYLDPVDPSILAEHLTPGQVFTVHIIACQWVWIISALLMVPLATWAIYMASKDSQRSG